MNNPSCPISYDLVNSRLTRAYSIITFAAIIVYVFTPFKEIIYISAIDFIIRVFFGVKYSIICASIKFTLKFGNFEPQMVNAGPKKFAAKIGLLFTTLMSLAHILNFENFSLSLGVISLIAVGAEAVFGYCVACKLHQYLPERFK